MNNAEAKAVIAEAMKTAGKQQTLNAIQWLGSFGVCKQESAYSDFVEYACSYIKSVPDSKKPSGYNIVNYDDSDELTAKYVIFFAADDIDSKK